MTVLGPDHKSFTIQQYMISYSKWRPNMVDQQQVVSPKQT